MSIRKFPAGEQSYNAATYVGTYGTIFYNEDTGEFRRSDGVTPGGLPIPITLATSTTAGSVRPGPGFTVGTGGLLSLNAGPSFYLDEEDVFRLRPGTADRIGGIKAGPGVVIDSEGTLFIDSEGLEFSFGDFTATVGTYSDSTEYALLSSIKEDEDVVIASNGTGTVCVVGELHVHKTNGDVTGSLEDGAVFEVLADGQIKAYVTELDNNAGALEIIGSSTGAVVAPGQTGTMLHLTGQIDQQCRFYMDGNGNYASIVGRRWNGSIAEGRTQVLANEDVLRINATAQTDAGMGGVSLAQIAFTALENQTATAQGSQISLVVTPVGSAATNRVDGLVVKATGIELPTAGSTVKLSGSTSGTITVQATATAGTNTITLPAVTGTVVTTGDTGTVTNTMLAGSIANNKLANSTISGVALGSNLAALSPGNYLTGTDYTGAATRTFAVDATTTNTASKVVARDTNGDFSARHISAKIKHATRNAGTVDGGLTLDYNTDDWVVGDFSSAFTITHTNLSAGMSVTVILYNTSGFGSDNITIGTGSERNSYQADPINVNDTNLVVLKFYSFGTTTNDLYCAVSYLDVE